MKANDALVLDDVSIPVAGRDVVREVSLTISPGDVVGLVGPNGCGKSTMLKALYRALRPSSGAVMIDGSRMDRLSFRESASLLAALPQEERGDLDFTVAEVVALGAAAHPTPACRTEQVVATAMARTGVQGLADRSFLGLSGGERQRTLLARALAQRTPYLLLDEPTNHLDLRYQVELVGLLRKLAHQTTAPGGPNPSDDESPTGTSTRPPGIIMALHDLNLAASACNRVVVMDRGRIVADGPPTARLDADLIEKVYAVRPLVTTRPDNGAPHFLFPW